MHNGSFKNNANLICEYKKKHRVDVKRVKKVNNSLMRSLAHESRVDEVRPRSFVRVLSLSSHDFIYVFVVFGYAFEIPESEITAL